MRSASFQLWCLSTLVLGLVSGCQEMGLPVGLIPGLQPSPTPGVQTAPGVQADAGSQVAQAEPGGDLAVEAQAYAERVASMGAGRQTQPPREILWTDLGGRPKPGVPAGRAIPVVDARPTQPTGAISGNNGVIEAGLTTPTQTHVSQTNGVQTAHPVSVSSPTGPVASGQPGSSGAGESLSQTQVYEQFLAAVRRGEDSNLSKAVSAATLAAIGPHGELDWRMLASLSPKDQEMVQGYHRSLVTLRSELLAGGGEVDREAVASRLDELFGSQPVTIRTVELCEKVTGYGVYDTFADNTFVAGREQKVIVYVELDHFKPSKRDSGEGYEVKLRQELELYESNGFEVWSHEPVQITDVSRNQRRDFFVVQMVTFPAELRMGQYHLKIRVYDENAGTRDEASVTIRLVADSSMVKGERR